MRRLNLLTRLGMVLTVLWLVGASLFSATQLRSCSGQAGWGCQALAPGAHLAPDFLGLRRLGVVGNAIVLVLMPPATAWSTFAHVRRIWLRRRR